MERILAPVAQGLLFVGVLLLLGSVTWRWIIAPGAARGLRTMGQAAPPPSEGTPNAGSGALLGTPGALSAMSGRVAQVGLAVSLALIPVWGMRMWAQLIAFRDPFVPLSEDLAFLLFETLNGSIWVAQGALLLALIGGFAWAGGVTGGMRTLWTDGTMERAADSESSIGDELPVLPWLFAGAGVLLFAGTLPLSSHAMGVEEGRTLALVQDGIHLLAAGGWIGSLALILLRTGSVRHEGPTLLAAQLRTFSPMAVVCVILLVQAGVFLSWSYVGSLGVSLYWETPYGRILAAKILLAGGVFLLGLLNWRRGLPSLDSEEGVRRVRRQATAEVGIALLVVALTALLTNTPKPY